MTTIQSTTQTSDQEVNSISPLSEINTQLEGLFAACWKDDAMKQRFMNDPKAVLAEHGMDVPDGIEVNVAAFEAMLDAGVKPVRTRPPAKENERPAQRTEPV